MHNPPNLNSYRQSQLNYLAVSHRRAQQTIKFICQGSYVYGKGNADFQHATALRLRDGSVLDLAATPRTGEPEDYAYSDRRYKLDSLMGLPLVNATVLFDGCAMWNGERVETEIKVESLDASLLPITDFKLRHFLPSGKTVLGIDLSAVCYSN